MQFDEGGKGYLDKSEAILRKYDTNNDGQFSLPELKNIIADLQSQEKKETRWRTYTKCAALFLLASVVCNFAMVWTAYVNNENVFIVNFRAVPFSSLLTF